MYMHFIRMTNPQSLIYIDPAMQEQPKNTFKPDPQVFTCDICKSIFDRPTTLNCGHTFCHQCLMKELTSDLDAQNSHLSLVPLCPTCEAIIWRPISSLKQNVAIRGLINRFSLNRPQPSSVPEIECKNSSCEMQYHIMLNCNNVSSTPMPACYSHIVFATAFIDQIIEQQAQTNNLVVKWPQAPEGLAIAGRILRPEIYHYSMPTGLHETVYRALFQGRSVVRVKQWQELNLKVFSASYHTTQPTSPMILCRIDEVNPTNPLSLDNFQPFFEIYDQLNNPAYMRQIAQLVNERVLHDRNNPQQIIYCILRVLRFKQKQVLKALQLMDDRQRWQVVKKFLNDFKDKPLEEIVKISTPGNYPHSLVFAILLILIFVNYLAQ